MTQNNHELDPTRLTSTERGSLTEQAIDAVLANYALVAMNANDLSRDKATDPLRANQYKIAAIRTLGQLPETTLQEIQQLPSIFLNLHAARMIHLTEYYENPRDQLFTEVSTHSPEEVRAVTESFGNQEPLDQLQVQAMSDVLQPYWYYRNAKTALQTGAQVMEIIPETACIAAVDSFMRDAKSKSEVEEIIEKERQLIERDAPYLAEYLQRNREFIEKLGMSLLPYDSGAYISYRLVRTAYLQKMPLLEPAYSNLAEYQMPPVRALNVLIGNSENDFQSEIAQMQPNAINTLSRYSLMNRNSMSFWFAAYTVLAPYSLYGQTLSSVNGTS